MPAIRALLNCAIFLVVLAGVSAAIGIALPFPKVPGIYPKWRHFAQHKDDYDVLFLGSSRVYQQIIPKQFDQRVADLSGRPVRSFNFGYLALWPPENFWLMRKVLALKPARVRWVILDVMQIAARPDERTMGTRRQSYWHDWQHTRIAWNAVLDLPAPPMRKWTLLKEHGGYLLREWTHQGRGAEWLAVRLGVEKRRKPAYWDPPAEWKETEGYAPESRGGLSGKEREDFVRTVEAHRQSFPEWPIAPSLRDALADIIAEIRAAGIEPILLVTPTVNARENFGGLPDGVAVWRFHNPNEFPELYDPANHYDAAHLNDTGARIFTDLLARRFTELR